MNKETEIKILFFGTSTFAVPALEALVKDGYKIVAVITRPDEPAGRKQILTPPPVKVAAEQHGIPVFQPEMPDARYFARKIPRADLFIVAAYGKIIPKEILDVPQYGALNIHPSLLPRWRGPSPIQYAILRGDEETGVTIMKIDEEMDHGPIIAQRHMAGDMRSIDYPTLHERLARCGAELLMEVLPRFLRGEIAAVPQDEAQATYCKILTRDDGRIDWRKSAEEIERMIRAFTPWPGAWTTWMTGKKSVRVRIRTATTVAETPSDAMPGSVWHDNVRSIAIATGRGSLAIQQLGVEGKKVMDAASFVRGHPDIIDAVLS